MASVRAGLLLALLLRQAIAAQVTYNLGDYKSYSGKATATPTLTGTQLAVVQNGDASETGIPKDGVDIFLSPALQTALASTIKSKCAKIDNDCYQSVRGVIISPSTELETRQLGALALIGAGIMGLISLTFPLWYKGDNTVPVHIGVPSSQLAAASAAETASVIAIGSGTGAASVLITPTPEPTKVTGVAPTVTTLAADGPLGKKGSVDFKMSKGLAGRVQEMIARTTTDQCDAVRTPSRLFKRSDLLNSVVCASSGVLTNMQPNGPFNDLLAMPVHDMTWLAADAQAALQQVMNLAREMAPVFVTPATTAATFGIIAFALAWDVIVAKKTLGEDNVIPAESLKLSSTQTSCGKQRSCQAGCTWIGNIERCSTTCTTSSTCNAQAATQQESVKTTKTVPWTADCSITMGSMTATGPSATSTKYTDRCKDWDIKNDNLLTATCTDKNGKSVKSTEDLNLCLTYNQPQVALSPKDNGQYTKYCHGCFFNPIGSQPPSARYTLWCLCNQPGVDTTTRSVGGDLDNFMTVQDDGYVRCFSHISAPS